MSKVTKRVVVCKNIRCDYVHAIIDEGKERRVTLEVCPNCGSKLEIEVTNTRF